MEEGVIKRGVYLPRFADARVESLVNAGSSVFVTGPRSCGKTTTASRYVQTIWHLDDAAQRAALAGSTDAILQAQRSPVLIDEWQLLPDVLSAVKRTVDRLDNRLTFLITGSVRARLATPSWPLTGRAVDIGMTGLAMAEVVGRLDAARWIDWVFSDEPPAASSLVDAPTVIDYAMLATLGGFPGALSSRTGSDRQDWFDGYLMNLVSRDVPEIADVGNTGGLRLLLRAVAANTAGLPSLSTLFTAAGLDTKTGRRYLDILEDLRVIERIPAWSANSFKRLVKTPKYYVVDSGIAARLRQETAASLQRDGNAIGRLIDTFVVSQVRPLLNLGVTRAAPYHLRDGNGEHEVDLLLQSDSGDIVGIEIKASATPVSRDARHLIWLQDQLPDRFRRGVVFHTGAMTYPLGERIWAVPIASLWHPEQWQAL